MSLNRKLEDKHGIATAQRAPGIAAHNEDNLEEEGFAMTMDEALLFALEKGGI